MSVANTVNEIVLAVAMAYAEQTSSERTTVDDDAIVTWELRKVPALARTLADACEKASAVAPKAVRDALD